MSKNDVWYGYLEAGEKSSPVVRDMSLETKSTGTVYLYNHTRGGILEYSREIVEPKLRELNSEDIPLNELRSAFRAARKAFLAGETTKKRGEETPASSTSVSKELDTVDDDFSFDLVEDLEEEQLEA
jgi:hypothetical protein